jgi:hypothetical protein
MNDADSIARLLSDMRDAASDGEFADGWHVGETIRAWAERIERLTARRPPEGWVLVPQEPTYEMLVAGADAHRNQNPDDDDTCRPTYCAMLDAAPKFEGTSNGN